MTRRSVSAGVLMRGGHCLKAWAKKQQVVALSSAESELYAGVKTAAEGLGLTNLARDMGFQSDASLRLDSSTALCLASRKGLGKANHVDMQRLWIQDAVRDGKLATRKAITQANPTGVMAKPLNGWCPLTLA